MSPGQWEDKALKVYNAWKDLRPTKSFYGMTLAEFAAVIQPSLDARAKLEEFNEKAQAAAVQRDKADALALPIVKGVVAAVIADQDEGEDGALYEGMGYVRRSARKSGLRRKGGAQTPQPAAP